MHKTTSTTKNYLAQTVNSAKVEKLWSRNPEEKQDFGRPMSFLSSAKKLTMMVEAIDFNYNIFSLFF